MKWHELNAMVEAFNEPQYSRASECESPIEIKLGEALEFMLANSFPLGDVELIPQFVLGRYRYDFAIRLKDQDRPIFLIECDGKAFHGPDQLANDLNKNKAAAEFGAPCLRYRGSDIWREPYVLAAEVVRAVAHLRKWFMVNS
jgi:very-short-patch-repair endonuclease